MVLEGPGQGELFGGPEGGLDGTTEEPGVPVGGETYEDRARDDAAAHDGCGHCVPAFNSLFAADGVPAFADVLKGRLQLVLGQDAVDVSFEGRLGKDPVVLHKEIPGFVANRILGAVRDEAIFLLENGIASVEDIDAACRTALGHPMGPFELMDLTGIDIGYRAKLARHAVTGDDRDLPSRTVSELVERGDLGRKTGKGFYSYEDEG